MDSMRSLNSSLPASRSSRPAPPEQLLQAFRTAALSVTNLYKSAVTDQANSRQAGYQDALEDLLKFLDKENLGLQDGEGWRVRQWATARYDGGAKHVDDSEGDEEQEEPTPRSRDTPQEDEDASPAQDQPEPVSVTSRPESEEDSDSNNRPDMFRFAANTQSDNSMHTDQPATSQYTEDHGSSSSSTGPIRVEVLNRSGRPTSRTHNTRLNAHSNQRDFTFTSGTKRKVQFPDFFNISNLNDRRDGSGGSSGSKRGRFV